MLSSFNFGYKSHESIAALAPLASNSRPPVTRKAPPGMTNPDLLRRFGLFVVENFLDARECHNLCGMMREGRAGKATVFKTADYVYDENVRRTKTARVGEAESRFVASRLCAVMPDAARHFGLQLQGTEEPQFLIYEPGDFFRLHRDRAPAAEHAPAHTRRRAVSLVLMLNDQTAEREAPRADTYGGGSLVLYGLGAKRDDLRLARIGFPVRGAAGLLIGFSPDLAHEVTPVTHGERLTVVSWFN